MALWSNKFMVNTGCNYLRSQACLLQDLSSAFNLLMYWGLFIKVVWFLLEKCWAGGRGLCGLPWVLIKGGSWPRCF